MFELTCTCCGPDIVGLGGLELVTENLRVRVVDFGGFLLLTTSDAGSAGFLLESAPPWEEVARHRRGRVDEKFGRCMAKLSHDSCP